MKSRHHVSGSGSPWSSWCVALSLAVCFPAVAAGGALAGETVAAAPTPYPCVGDCNSHGVVTIGDLVTMVNIALDNASISACGAGDRDDNGRIEVPEIIAAVNAVLNGCSGLPWGTPTASPTPSPTATPVSFCGNGRIEPPEQCDQGNSVDGDGCDSHCQVEPDFMCDGEPSRCIIGGPCPSTDPVCSPSPVPRSLRTPAPQPGTNRAPRPTATPAGPAHH
jgi:cysteine-rich repeat protein